MSILTEEQLIEENYKHLVIRTQEDLLEQISKKRKFFEEIIQEEPSKKGYYEALDGIFEKLYKMIDGSCLFDAPGGMWHYEIFYNSNGVKVYLNLEEIHNASEFYTEGWEYTVDMARKIENHIETIDSYVMFEVPAKLLTVEEYAERYGVKVVTVRQWIRRGKIRSAIKYGGEWRIPELAPAPNIERGYVTAYYDWEEKLEDVPEDFAFINEYRWVRIMHTTGKEYELYLSNYYEKKDHSMIINEAEKEKLELYLIANAKVKNRDTGNSIKYR